MKRNSIKKRIMSIAFSVLVILATCVSSPIKVYADGVDIESKSFTMMTGGEATLKAGDELYDVEDPSKRLSVNELSLISVFNGTLTMSTNGTDVVIGNDALSVHIYGGGKLILLPMTMLKCSSFLWDVSDSSGISGLINVGGTFSIGDDIAADFTFNGSSLDANKIYVNKGNFTNNTSTTTTLINIHSDTTASNTKNMTATTVENDGTFTNSGTGILTTDHVANNSSFTNAAGGTINATKFESAGTVTNNGTISCEEATIAGKISGSGTFNVSDTLTIKKSDGETYYVDDGATVVFAEDLTQTGSLPTIITGPNTKISDKSHAANYYLKVGNGDAVTKEIQTYAGWADEIPASELYKDDPTVSSEGFPLYFYYGMDYDPADYYTVTRGGELSIGYQKKISSVEYEDLDEKPTEIGSYRPVVKLTATDTYRDMGTYFPAGGAGDPYDIKYLPKSSIKNNVPYATVSGDRYDGYDVPIYKDKAVFTAPEGFKFYDADLGDSDTLTVSSNYREDGLRSQLRVVGDDIKDTSNRNVKGAITESFYCYTGEFIVDTKAPVLVNAYDQDEENVTIDEKVTTVRARSLTLEIEDNILGDVMLDAVTVNGSEEGVTTGADGKKTVTLKMVLPGKKTYEVVAKDYVGHTSKWTINMEYLPTATPETPFTVSGTEGKNGYYTSDVTLVPAEGYKISADVNGTFTDTLIYKPEIDSVYLMDGAGLFTTPIAVDSYLIDKTMPAFSTGEDENGNKFEIVDGLEVHAKKLSLSVSDANLTAVTVNGEAVDITDGAAAIELVPETGQSGNYEIYAEDIAGNSIQATVTVEYLKDVATATVSVNDNYVGVKFEPALITNSDGTPEYYYKKVGSSDETYSTVLSGAEGKYEVQVRIPATDRFTAVTDEATFELSYLPAPETIFTITATEGKNDFYTSDVEINAPEGFLISSQAGGKYKASITYTEGMDKIYLMREDGALTGAIAFNEKYKIDKLSPEASKAGTLTNNKTLKTKLIDIKNGMSIYADTLDFSIFDENLATITINGETVEFNEKTAKILLDANNKTSKFNIVAEDKAGNTTSLSIVLKAAWLENNIIPSGAKITLEAGQVYNLEDGKWTVSGDSTVYYGGNSFCVDGSMDCVFSEAK